MNETGLEPLPFFERIAETFSSLLKERLKDQLESVILYGSTARKMVDDKSDIDILIIARGLPKEYYKRIELIYPIIAKIYRTRDFRTLNRKGISPKIEYIVLGIEEAAQTTNLDFDLLTDAKALYDRGFFAEKMASLKEKMERLGSRKVVINEKTWYWDLKPDLKVGDVIEI